MFTLGGGGAHCLGQALHREAMARRVTDGPAIDAGRVVADLRELHALTGTDAGAQRVCWTETWRQAQSLLAERLGELGLEPERDEAGNVWAYLEGDAEPALAVGSHVDSVPDGGWLDGALGVMAALGVVRAWAESGERPPRTLAFVDWADEEGARFGRSLFGSSAFSGTLVPDEARELRDSEGVSIVDALAENGVELDRVLEAGSRRSRLGAYLELHIEQGPVLEAEGLRSAAVNGCVGIERHRFRFRGQASHAGTTPMDRRRDAGLAAADAALAHRAGRAEPRRHGDHRRPGAAAGDRHRGRRRGRAVGGPQASRRRRAGGDAGGRVGLGSRRRPPNADASSPPSTSGRSSRSRSTPLWWTRRSQRAARPRGPNAC